MKVIKKMKTKNEGASKKNNEDGTSGNVSFSFFLLCNVSLLLDAHVYGQRKIRDSYVKVLEPCCVDINGSSDEDEDNLYVYSSDDGGSRDVMFDDSEDERVALVNDGFEAVEVEVPAYGSNRVNVGGKSLRIKKCASKSPMKKNSPKKQMKQMKLKQKATEDDDDVSDDGEYFSQELDSSDPDASDGENGIRYEKFRPEQLNAQYEFKLGMEFNSLTQFKDAIREWKVLNGYVITFLKNESYRARAICKGRCEYLAFCSKVGDRHTYQLKTLKPKHKCSRM